MKRILALLLSLSFAAATYAATLPITDAGPEIAASFNSSWQTVVGWDVNAVSSSLITVKYDARLVAHGAPMGGKDGTMRITVYDYSTHSMYSTTYCNIQVGGSTLVSVPSGRFFNVSIWIMSGQSSAGLGSQNYWALVLQNIKVTGN